ncbi:hypothetical protein FRC07_001667 [Ceratobasidium sp. 392]|nr:hypothetical protein FRC07_001667 [Ceratobasidium sp. 392]
MTSRIKTATHLTANVHRPTSAVQKTLDVSELGSMIFSLLPRSSLASCMRVSWTLKAHAEGPLWSDIPSLLIPLDVLARGDLRVLRARKKVDKADTRPYEIHVVEILSRATEEDWGRFNHYASFVKRLRVFEKSEPHGICLLRHFSYRGFDSLPVGRPLFPNLRELNFVRGYHEGQSGLLRGLLSSFCGSSLARLRVGGHLVGHRDGDDVVDILHALGPILTSGARLEEVRLYPHPTSQTWDLHNFGSIFEATPFSCLRTLLLDSHLLQSDLIAAVARLPQLQRLILVSETPEIENKNLQLSSLLRAVNLGASAELARLELRGEWWDLSSLCDMLVDLQPLIARLKHLRIYAEGDAASTTRLCEMLQSSAAQLRVLELGIRTENQLMPVESLFPVTKIRLTKFSFVSGSLAEDNGLGQLLGCSGVWKDTLAEIMMRGQREISESERRQLKEFRSLRAVFYPKAFYLQNGGAMKNAILA